MIHSNITIHADVETLLALPNLKEARAAHGSSEIQGNVAQGTGWHLYPDLRIHSHYVCDPDASKRQQTMKALVKLGQVSLAVATKFGGQLLEHQGQRTHLWIPCSNTPEGQRQILSALLEIDYLVRMHVQPLIPSGWKSYASSADFGPTVFVRSADLNGGDSIVSLSPAANRPAKVLFQLTDGEIWLAGQKHNARALSAAFGTEQRATADPATVAGNFSQVDAFRGEAMVKFAKEHHIAKDSLEPCLGYVFRADIDGFSALIQGAFSRPTDMKTVVAGFIAASRNVKTYAESTPIAAFVQLPWAGDCCTLVAVVEDHAEYRVARESTIVEVAVEFEAQCGTKMLSPLLGNVAWAYSVAGGDAHGNQIGNLLIANITLGSRTFMVGAGKGIRRSLDAETQITIPREQTSLFIEDKPSLKPHLRAEFAPGNSNFHLAKVADLKKSNATIQAGIQPVATTTSQFRPTPRPYFGDH